MSARASAARAKLKAKRGRPLGEVSGGTWCRLRWAADRREGRQYRGGGRPTGTENFASTRYSLKRSNVAVSLDDGLTR